MGTAFLLSPGAADHL